VPIAPSAVVRRCIASFSTTAGVQSFADLVDGGALLRARRVRRLEGILEAAREQDLVEMAIEAVDGGA